MEWVLLRHEEGRCREALKDYKGAFQAHREANLRRRLPFDAPAHSARIDGIVSAYSHNYSRSTSSDQTPVFIVGLPRSGTSLCEQILASHPQIHGAGELESLRGTLATLAEKEGRQMANAITSMRTEALNELAGLPPL
jgi:hypothetical protein